MNKYDKVNNIINMYEELVSANLDYIGNKFVDLSFEYDDNKGDAYVDAKHGELIRATIKYLYALEEIKKGGE